MSAAGSTDRLIQRMRLNAEHLMDSYPTSEALLRDAVREALPWAGPAAMQGRPPNLPQLERLATQILAILMASQPPAPEPGPAMPENVDTRGRAAYDPSVDALGHAARQPQEDSWGRLLVPSRQPVEPPGAATVHTLR